MKTFSKGKPAKTGKGKATVIDGRSNPAPLDVSKFAAFGCAKNRKLPAKVAQQLSATPMRHQSGKGTRGVRESIDGVSKTGVIRWLAANGYDIETARDVVVKLFTGMTAGVFSKHYGYGLQGLNVPVMPATAVATVKRYAK